MGRRRRPPHPARTVPCPHCGAGAGRPCKRPSGHAFFGGGVHRAREDRHSLRGERAEIGREDMRADAEGDR